MKKLLIGLFIGVNLFLLLILAVLIFGAVQAEEACTEVVETKDINTPTPENLKGATIIVKQKDGTMKEMPANEFKVVPRKQQFITKSTMNCSNVKSKKNRLALVGGYGPGGNIDKSISGNKATIETEFRPNIGLQYQRVLGDRFSVGVQGLSNRSLELLLGLDF